MFSTLVLSLLTAAESSGSWTLSSSRNEDQCGEQPYTQTGVCLLHALCLLSGGGEGIHQHWQVERKL